MSNSLSALSITLVLCGISWALVNIVTELRELKNKPVAVKCECAK